MLNERLELSQSFRLSYGGPSFKCDNMQQKPIHQGLQVQIAVTDCPSKAAGAVTDRILGWVKADSCLAQSTWNSVPGKNKLGSSEIG